MTANFKQFKELVEKKFGSLSNLSMITTGSFMSYQGLRSLKDDEDNYWRIDALIKLAKRTDFDLEKVEISGDDRLQIICQIGFIIATTDYKNANEWLIAHRISHSLYSSIISGRSNRKNLAFERLWGKLGL